MAISLSTVTLPGDLQWIDEFTWTPVSQQVEVTFNGALVIEESAQQAGRPITLQGRQDGDTLFAVVERDVVEDLQALAAAPLSSPLTLTLEDGRSFQVRFNYAAGNPVEAAPYRHVTPPASTDWYALTLRLLQV
jgi:hypothetical protein